MDSKPTGLTDGPGDRDWFTGAARIARTAEHGRTIRVTGRAADALVTVLHITRCNWAGLVRDGVTGPASEAAAERLLVIDDVLDQLGARR